MFYIIKQQIDHHGSFYFSLISVLVFFSTRLLVFHYFVLDLVNPWQRPQAGRGHGQSVWLVWSLLSSYWLLFLLVSNGSSNCSFSFLLSWCSLYLTSLLAPLHILIIVSDREWDRRQGEGRGGCVDTGLRWSLILSDLEFISCLFILLMAWCMNCDFFLPLCGWTVFLNLLFVLR